MNKIKIAIVKEGVTPSWHKIEGTNFGPVGWFSRSQLGLSDEMGGDNGLVMCVFPIVAGSYTEGRAHGYGGDSGKASEYATIGMTYKELCGIAKGNPLVTEADGQQFEFTFDDTYKETNDDSLKVIGVLEG